MTACAPPGAWKFQRWLKYWTGRVPNVMRDELLVVDGAVRRMRAEGGSLPVEVEAQSLAEVADAVAAGADIVLLDNLSLEDIRQAVARCRGRALRSSRASSLSQSPPGLASANNRLGAFSAR